LIGEIGGDRLSIACDDELLIEDLVATLEEMWRTSLPLHLDRPMQAATG
jgi:hypothetical protein